MRNAMAVTAAVVAACSTLPYLIDIVRRRTKPNIVSWLTWTVLTAIATVAAFAVHEPRTALLTLGSTFCTGAVVVMGIKYGVAKFSRFDIACQLGAVLGLVCWLLFKSPLIGIIVPVAIDLVGALPTIRHSWLKPGEETWQTFSIGVFASSLTVASLTHYNIANLLYPAYLICGNGVVVIAILYRRKQSGLDVWRGGDGQALYQEAK